MADEKETEDKKADKKAEKQRKKEEKKKAKQDKKKDAELEDEYEESAGSKIAVVFVTLIIIIIWLAILALLVKMDVGGFGSTVLTPLLKDVPYVNKILPDTEDEFGTEDTEYPYQTLDEAVAYIKELELELQAAQEGSSQNSEYVAQLEAEVAKLRQYEQNEADFEELKAQFYEEVVFNDKAPDISEYQKYYESIDPANAEELYKQVVEQVQEDEELQEYISKYSQMKPKEAAAIFDTMTDNLDLVAKILENMDTQSAANILGKMDSETAARVTELMEPEE